MHRTIAPGTSKSTDAKAIKKPTEIATPIIGQKRRAAIEIACPIDTLPSRRS
jgi:hypothetical protein